MEIHDLMIGSFNFPVDPNSKFSSLESFFPLYLYKGKYYIVPDFSQQGTPPLTRKDPDDMFLLNDEIPTSHLSNVYSRGWYNINNITDYDPPIVSKTTVVSFDILTFDKNIMFQTLSHNIFAIDYFDRNKTFIFRLVLNCTLMITAKVGEVYIGQIAIILIIYYQNAVIVNEIIVLNLVSGAPAKSTEYTNRNNFHFNDYETKFKLEGLISKKTITVVVSYVNISFASV